MYSNSSDKDDVGVHQTKKNLEAQSRVETGPHSYV